MSVKIMPHHLHHTLPKPSVKQTSESKATEKNSFQNMLTKTLESQEELKISKHAEKRMMDRGIEISNETWNEIQTKVREARDKGVNDSLVLTNDAAFVISATNDTVITAMDREEAASQLFTNINGAIIINN
ncbi:flagellar protein [Salipaludibacillus neizhouensis]|uniref:Flagellar protein n=1 Tax=Salipaludibacillus neizhouensis TaxID=885475 RepID=A0A3A9K9X2_9BACI|nr:TIGR02530 family flagellar biosynthesis protein [Salipaludibacillus neizhouensis]RKL68999.1 flagellar protein [Salipaludibacillus neizhouensis]